MRVRSHLAAMLAAFLVLAGLVAAGSATATATATAAEPESGYTVSGGSLDWGFKESFRSYVPKSGQSAAGGAVKKADGTFSWTVASGGYDPDERALTADADGQVIFNFQGHNFEIVIADPVVTVEGGAGLLNAEITVKTLDAATGEVRATRTERADLADLDLARGTRVVGDGTIEWTGIPATMTAEGAEAFAADMAGDGTLTHFYSRGTILDPVNLQLSGDWPAQSEEETWTAPGARVPVDVERLVPHIGLAATDYIVQVVSDPARGILYALVYSYSGTSSSVWAIDAENGGLVSEQPVLASPYLLANILVDPGTGTLLASASTPAGVLGLEPANSAISVLVAIPRTEDGWGTPVYRTVDRNLNSLSGFDADSGDVYGVTHGSRWTPEGEAVSAPAYAFTRYPGVLATPGVADLAELPGEPRAEGVALHGGDWDLTRAVLDEDRGQALLWYRNYADTPAQVVVVPLGSDSPAIVRHNLPAAGADSGVDTVALSPDGILFVSLTDGTIRAIDVTEGWTEIALLPHALSSPSLVVDEAHGILWVQGVGTTTDGNPVGAYDISAADPAQWRATGRTRLVAPGYAYSTHPMAVGGDGDLLTGIYRYSSRVGVADEHGVRRVRMFTSPAITTQPIDAAVVEGSGAAAEFEVEATGSPEPTIVWQERSAFGWSDLADGDGISGATTGTLRLDGDAVVEGRQVRAVVSNAVADFRGAAVEVGSLATDVATLSVHRPPVVATQPTAQTVLEGADATFRVLGDGNPEPVVMWQRRVAGYWQPVVEDDDNFSVDAGALTVLDANVDQSGSLFRARLRNAAGTTYSSTAELTVNPRVSVPEGGLSLDGVVLEWSGSEELQARPPFGSSNYLSAGVSDGDAATYRQAEGDVEIVHVASDGAEVAATYATRAAQVGGEVTQTVRLSGGAAEVEADGSAIVEWEGTFSVNFYDGLVPFWLSDPVLTVAADGSGALTADLDGYGSSQSNPNERHPLDEVPDVTVATFAGAEVDPTGVVTVDPDYAGVEIDVPGDQPQQNRTAVGWGAWPQPFVDVHLATGLSSYWYSSGGTADPKKSPAAFTVDFTDAEEVEPAGPEPTSPPAQEPAAKVVPTVALAVGKARVGRKATATVTVTLPRGVASYSGQIVVRSGGKVLGVKRVTVASGGTVSIKLGKRVLRRLGPGRHFLTAVARPTATTVAATSDVVVVKVKKRRR